MIKHPFFRFLVVGVGANFINFTFYSITFKTGLSISFASLIGYILGLFFSYHFNRIWVHGEKHEISSKNIVAFCIVYATGGIFMGWLITQLHNHAHLNYVLSWFIAAT
ncbi:GtrA family protein, partial [Vibrio fluvialis]|nr:GtrA family protein [Vibrio fluvialis]